MLEGQVGVLEAAHGEVNIVPLLLLRGDEKQHEIGADGKIHGLVGDDHGVEIGVQALDAGLDHGGDVVADGVHLGVEFAAENAVAEIDEAGAGIARDFLGAILERFEKDDAGRLGNFPCALAARSKDESSPWREIRRTICARRQQAREQAAAERGLLRPAARLSASTPRASHSSNGPSSQAKPQRMARSTSAMESAISGMRRAA